MEQRDPVYIAIKIRNHKAEYLCHIIRKRGLSVKIWCSDTSKIKHLTFNEACDILDRVRDVTIQRIDL